MAQLPSVFNASSNEKMTSFDPIPAGWYEAEIIKSSIMRTKAGTGQYIKLQFKVTEGDYAKRLVFANLNIDNPNQIAVEIAKKELASICEACGLDDLEDTDEMHNIPIGIRVVIREATAKWPASNEIKEYADSIPTGIDTYASAEGSPF